MRKEEEVEESVGAFIKVNEYTFKSRYPNYLKSYEFVILASSMIMFSQLFRSK